MSWIIRSFWQKLEERRDEYEKFLAEGKPQAFGILNRIASEVGAQWGVLLQLNFPLGQKKPDLASLGHRNLSMIVDRGRRKFEGVTEEEVRETLQSLNPLLFEGAGFGYEGFKVGLASGRIDCLPGGVHLWCEITPKVLEVLDWLFVNAYGLEPAK